jgi:hypothetical protein
MRLVRFLSSSDGWILDDQLETFLRTKAHAKLLEKDNKYVFCAEIHKVFSKKDSKQWIDMCCLMIKYNLHTINLRINEAERKDLADKVRQSLE